MTAKSPHAGKSARAAARAAEASRAESRALSPAAMLSIGAAVLAGGAALVGIFARRREWLIADAGHAAPDLALDQPRPGAGDRAPPAFRPASGRSSPRDDLGLPGAVQPDAPTAPVSASEREALRPATMPAPKMADG